ncbi:MAG: hypothetical protein H7A25_11185 [Leptospiraceae bacterium]|nr:hypothetical protein [Leptospiraceae bacterium]MCP5500459.1 hypothetical protein [Leptospiraceae bacterium]
MSFSKNNSLEIVTLGEKRGLPIIILQDIFTGLDFSDLSDLFQNYFQIHHCKLKLRKEHFKHQIRGPINQIQDIIFEIQSIIKTKAVLLTGGFTSIFLFEFARQNPNKVKALISLSPPPKSTETFFPYSTYIKILAKNSICLPELYSFFALEKINFMKRFFKYQKLVYSQKLYTKTYLMYEKKKTGLLNPSEIDEIFKNYRVIKFDTPPDTCFKEKRFKKVLYSVFKEETKLNPKRIIL